jgi:hypothetical protein
VKIVLVVGLVITILTTGLLALAVTGLQARPVVDWLSGTVTIKGHSTLPGSGSIAFFVGTPGSLYPNFQNVQAGALFNGLGPGIAYGLWLTEGKTYHVAIQYDNSSSYGYLNQLSCTPAPSTVAVNTNPMTQDFAC